MKSNSPTSTRVRQIFVSDSLKPDWPMALWLPFVVTVTFLPWPGAAFLSVAVVWAVSRAFGAISCWVTWTVLRISRSCLQFVTGH